jgi:hypothetical protein
MCNKFTQNLLKIQLKSSRRLKFLLSQR